MRTLHFPEGINPSVFLNEYWQKKPLLIRNAISDYRCPLTPEELAGLSCDEEVESRIVLEKDGVRPWEARFGPFDDEDFSSLPPSHWTLLVQDVDKHLDEVAELLDYFHFLPTWRLDDIMISYATDQGSVGPHIDDYDVFLFQTAGQRRWQIHTRPVSENDFIPGLDLRILPEFEAEHDWLLEPGDILYLPPNVAHWGVAQGDGCMTCSVGFRTPTFQEMVADWCDEMIEHHIPPGRYRDGIIEPQQAIGEILPQALSRMHSLMKKLLETDPEQQARWFGRFMTDPKAHLQVFPREQDLTPEEVKQSLQTSDWVMRNGWSRFAFSRGAHQDFLYVNGNDYGLSKTLHPLLVMLTQNRTIEMGELQKWCQIPESLEILTRLFNEGHLIFDHD
jgi:50S ribosomal protein L16 3-hydroxylase